MKILGIETSCDETAVCLIECSGKLKDNSLQIRVLGNELHSQIESHQKFGGVVPMMAKREHAKNLIPLFLKVMEESGYSSSKGESLFKISLDHNEKLTEIFGRETEFRDEFIKMVENLTPPSPMIRRGGIDAIAITEGPGLEPALWMGIIFAQALSLVFDVPLIPVNHMEGHVLSALVKKVESQKVYKVEKEIKFPIISLLISGGHTELILMRDWNSYEILGATRDDAVGEAFDKVARMLGLPYPGGPEISKLAEMERINLQNRNFETKTSTPKYILPRPMIYSKDYDFSFSGLKTAVLNSLDKKPSNETVSKEFEDAVTEVLISKTLKAVEEFNAKTLVLGGGVVSNEFIRSEFEEKLKNMVDVEFLIPEQDLRTDNALMIAIAGYEKTSNGFDKKEIRARGTLKLS